VIPTDKKILIESIENLVLIHSCLGSLGNETLARAIASVLTLRLGTSVKSRADPYRILFELPRPVDPNQIKNILVSLQNLESLIENNLINSSLFKYKLTHQARTFGFIGKENALTQRVRGFLAETIIHRETIREIFHTYLDLQACNDFLVRLRKNECKVEVIIANEPTILGRQGLLKIRASELISPIEPHSEILKAFKKSILDKRARFICTYCKKIFYVKIEGLSKAITCEHCKSSLVALVDRQKQVAVLQKKRDRLTEEEKKEYYNLQRIASLVNAYGKKAVVALNVYGVGTETAARVLQKLHREDDTFFIDLLEAQKQFIRTKKYWKA
ncbi:hypothetical protein HY570_00190, partial [Candidatus Micrarchaeota archaeon]|nr:hypothetical protein [Candidatus Micrarchaeota archaeon]